MGKDHVLDRESHHTRMGFLGMAQVGMGTEASLEVL